MLVEVLGALVAKCNAIGGQGKQLLKTRNLKNGPPSFQLPASSFCETRLSFCAGRPEAGSWKLEAGSWAAP